MIEKKSKNNPLLAAVKPLARQYVNTENISRLFDKLTEQCELEDGEKPVIIISRGEDSVVYGGLYGVRDNTVSSMFSHYPVEQLLDELLK